VPLRGPGILILEYQTRSTLLPPAIAISVPEDVLAQVDAAAAERGENRSRFITQMLVLVARVRTDREISRRVERGARSSRGGQGAGQDGAGECQGSGQGRQGDSG
jgi:hypothetical protein